MGKKRKRKKRSRTIFKREKGNPVDNIAVEEVSPSFTSKLHKDKKETLVVIEGELHKLVPVGKKLKELLREKDYKKVPHVRYLNPIRERTPEEQSQKNKETEEIHELSLRVSRPSDKVTSIKKAIVLGKDVPKEIERLFKEKEEAQKKGDEKKTREIRKQLRGLDYKRYLVEGGKKK